MPITLSYILTTRNKLPYLTHTLEVLVSKVNPGEEILVADAGSTDGTKEYLAKLFAEKKIDFYLSESDAGESHGYNKLLLAARGELIKIITDDDAFYYPGIAACKEFMQEHPEIDLLNTNGMKRRKKGTSYPYGPLLYQSSYEQWKNRGVPFSACGLGLMLRKTSLPLLGLLDTSFVRADAEYTLRTTSGKANIGWYTHECYARILNPQSNTSSQATRYYEETERLEAFYFGKPLPGAIARALHKGKHLIKKLLGKQLVSLDIEGAFTFDEWLQMFASSTEWLEKNAAATPKTFLHR